MLPFFLFHAGAPSSQAGFKGLLGFWAGGAGAGEAAEPTPTPEPRPEVEGGGVGSPVKKPRGPYVPAFRRSVRDLYRPADLTPEPEKTEQPEPEAPKPEPPIPSPLPMVMDFGSGPKTVGLMVPLSEQIQNQILADDDDAIIAILLALD